MNQTFLETSAPKSSVAAPKATTPVLDESPASVAQRKRQEAMEASETNAALQRRVAQLQAPAEEEELLQGKFETAQLEGIEEEEPLQGKDLQLKAGVAVNDDPALEHEADVMGANAMQTKPAADSTQLQEGPADKTGLPNQLKAGVEALSGQSLADVKVNYNSSKPAQLNALAYAQGTDIHIGPGQEQHLPHEAWHVAQQKQGRVQATTQMKGNVNINDDAGLEKVADMMGAKALQQTSENNNGREQESLSPPSIIPIQRMEQATVIQLGPGKNGEDKKKGDDYCNNIGKTLSGLESALNGFLNDAISNAIATINANRAKCSVTTSLVKGVDTNTAEYGQFSSDLMAVVNQIVGLIHETNMGYFNETAPEFGRKLRTLFNRIPTVAIDERVAAVIRAGTEGDISALEAINAALITLRNELKARIRDYLLSIGPYAKKDDDKPQDPDGGAGGVGAIGRGHLVPAGV